VTTVDAMQVGVSSIKMKDLLILADIKSFNKEY
jgi:hypothetical protein